MTKALRKKGDNCNRQHLTAELKPGKNLVITLSTAAYELAKQAIPHILSVHKDILTTEQIDGLDNNGSQVDKIYKVFNKKIDGTIGKQQKFTINLYHTSSQILVNGNRIDIFVELLYQKLCDEIKKEYHNLNIMNNDIFSAIEQNSIRQGQSLAIQNSEEKVLNNPRETVEVNNTTITAHNIENNTSYNMEKKELEQLNTTNLEQSSNINVQFVCPICNQSAGDDTIECSECRLWIHFECAKISNRNLPLYKKKDYICIICRDNMIYNKEHKQSQDECHEIALATTQNDENSLDDSLTYVKTRLPVATTSIHTSTPELTDKTKNMSTGQNLNGEKTIPIATTTSLHSSAQETPEPVTETPTTNNHENMASMDKMEDNTKKLKAKRTTKSKSKDETNIDKAYITQLELQVERLTSTVELLQQSQNLKQRENNNVPQTYEPTRRMSGFDTCQTADSIHTFCSQLIDQKLNEHRIRSLEMQMIQNMQIMQAQQMQMMMHCQNTQARPYATPQYSPYLANNQYVIPPYRQQQHVQANHHMYGLSYTNRQQQPPYGHFIPPPQPRPQVPQQTHGPPIGHYIPPPTYQVPQQNHQQMPMGNQYQQIPNQNTTPSQRPYISTNTQLDRRTNRTQLNHKTQQETVPQCTNLE